MTTHGGQDTRRARIFYRSSTPDVAERSIASDCDSPGRTRESSCASAPTSTMPSARRSNGVSRDIKTFVKFVGPAAPSITDAKAWSEWCGDGHDVHFLTLADGVMPLATLLANGFRPETDATLPAGSPPSRWFNGPDNSLIEIDLETGKRTYLVGEP